MHPASYKALVLCVVVLFIAVLSWVGLSSHLSSKKDAEQKPEQSNAQPRGGENRKLTANDVNMLVADADNDDYTSMTRDWTLRSCPLTPSDECVRLLEQSGLKFGDCDDQSASVHPSAPEIVDGEDNDCDGKLANGECANDAPCDDGNVCTVGDECVNGVCTGEKAVCDDNEPCTIDPCDPIKGCFHEPIFGCCHTDEDCRRPEWLPDEYLWACLEHDGRARWCLSCEDTDGDSICSIHEQDCDDGLDGDADMLIDKDDSDCANPPP